MIVIHRSGSKTGSQTKRLQAKVCSSKTYGRACQKKAGDYVVPRENCAEWPTQQRKVQRKASTHGRHGSRGVVVMQWTKDSGKQSETENVSTLTGEKIRINVRTTLLYHYGICYGKGQRAKGEKQICAKHRGWTEGADGCARNTCAAQLAVRANTCGFSAVGSFVRNAGDTAAAAVECAIGVVNWA